MHQLRHLDRHSRCARSRHRSHALITTDAIGVETQHDQDAQNPGFWYLRPRCLVRKAICHHFPRWILLTFVVQCICRQHDTNLLSSQSSPLLPCSRSNVYVSNSHSHLPPKFSIHKLTDLGADAPTVIWSMVELCMGITSACLPTLGPIVTYIKKGPPASHIIPKSPFTPERATPDTAVTPNPTLKTTSTTKSTRTDLKTRNLDRSQWDALFSQLENNPQQDLERNWTPGAPVAKAHNINKGGVEMVSVRSCSSSSYEEDPPISRVEASTHVQHDA